MLFCLVLLALGVMRLPQVYGQYSDRRTLNQPEYAENELKVYAYDYSSMVEKLQVIYEYQERGIGFTALFLPEAADSQVSEKELESTVQDELDRLQELAVFTERIDLQEYTISDRQLLNLYPENGDRLKGKIGMWQVTLEKIKSSEDMLQVWIDTEYHKVYNLVVTGSDADRMCLSFREWLIQEIKKEGKRGAELAAEKLNSLSEGFAEYYGCAVPERRAWQAAFSEEKRRVDKEAGQIAGAYSVDGEKNKEEGIVVEDIRDLEIEKTYGNVYFLENLFGNIVKHQEHVAWDVWLPAFMDLGEGIEKHAFLKYRYEYLYDLSSFSITHLWDIDL